MYAFTRTVLRYPVASLAILVALTVFFGVGLFRLRMEFSFNTIVGRDHPEVRTIESFIERYGGGIPILIVWDCGSDRPCQSVFDDVSLVMAYTLESHLTQVKGIRGVLSPASASLLVPDESGFAVRRFIEHGEPASDKQSLIERALGDPLWVGNLISPDAKVGAIIVQLADTENETMVFVVDAMQTALAPFEARGFRYYPVGHPFELVVGARELASSTQAVTLLLAAVLALVIFSLTRSVHAVGVTMTTMGVALLWTFGLLGWLDWPQDHVLQVLAPVVLSVGVCDAIHLLSRYRVHDIRRGERSTGWQRRKALLDAVREVGPPCLITSATTGIALASFATSALGTFVRFGVISALGVTACLLLTFSLLPLLVWWVPPLGRPERQFRSWDGLINAIIRTSQRRAIPILSATAVLVAVCMVSWFRDVKVDTDQDEVYAEHSRITRAIRFVDSHLRGMDSLEIDVALPERSPLESPETQRELSDFVRFLSTTEGLGRTTSVQDLLARVNRTLHGDDPQFGRPAKTLEANAELLELLSFDDPGLLEQWITVDRSRLRLSVEGPPDSAMGRGEVLRTVREYIDAKLPPDWHVTLTGPFALEFVWVDALQSTALRSFFVAFVLVFLLVALFLHSVSLGMVALLPALVPVVVTLGVMGFAGINLDIGRVMIAAVVLGIAVDDAIHLLSRYRIRRQHGDARGQAIAASILHIGRAVVLTSVVLALGFLTLVLSSWQTISSFGFLVSFAILGALIATLFVLPALFFVSERKQETSLEGGLPPSRKQEKSRRSALLVLLVLPAAAVIVSAAFRAAISEPSKELACWILPNGRVMAHVLATDQCPLETNDEVRSADVEGRLVAPIENLRELDAALADAGSSVLVGVVRAHEERVFEVGVREVSRGLRAKRVVTALLFAGLVLSIPLVLLRRSPSPAAIPFAFFYGAIAVVIAVVLCAESSPWPYRAGVCAAVAAPALLMHLSLTFPAERRVLREAPAAQMLPYALSGMLLPAGLVALERGDVFWPAFLWLLVGLTAAAWLILGLSCVFALRESTSPLERARARLVLSGAFLPLIPALWSAEIGISTAAATYLAASAVLMPMPVALAISRYNLFDLGAHARQSIARLLYFAVGAGGVTIVLRWSGLAERSADPVMLFAACLGSLIAVEWLRRWLLGFLEGVLVPRAAQLRELGDEYAQKIAELRERGEVAQLLGDALERALRPRAGYVFLLSGGKWHPEHVMGKKAPMRPGLVADAGVVLKGHRVLHLAAEIEPDSPWLQELRAEGVELVVALERAGEMLGMVLLTDSRTGHPYTGLELSYAARAADQATLALVNAQLARDRVEGERQATMGRTALGLLHEVRKGLDWIRSLSGSLARRVSDTPGATRDVQDIQDLSVDMVQSLERFVRNSTQEVSQPGQVPCDRTIDRAIRTMERGHGQSRISRSLDPHLNRFLVHEGLERVLVNLLDNALRASPGDLPVHLSATLDGNHLVVSVADGGPGMDPETLTRAFEPGFSTRSDRGGTGIGLPLSREIVESLAGTIDLQSTPGGGTRVIVRLPVTPPSRRVPKF